MIYMNSKWYIQFSVAAPTYNLTTYYLFTFYLMPAQVFAITFNVQSHLIQLFLKKKNYKAKQTEWN